ncbi:LPXTG-motif cell wall-anchored protein [Streptomyces sp. V3I8]|uniref:chaplin family protein n=1 Tax=Streptomyces sp. V3I8 TaxID=3042279 RepID=UPI00278926A7|nr:chaplin family protein [Streptomyces sp. V3I8]MDQ1038535.1 LPXTG-motif cell wall-anchored protein [Streptomyces sp. V3I8]
MRQTLSKGMVAAAAATSILSLCSSQAFADSDASAVAADSPGVLSGNSVQAPLDVPVNACGNSANAVAALNPSFGNSCATPTGKHRKPDAPRHGATSGHGSSHHHAPGTDRSPGHGSDHAHGSGHGSDHAHGSDHGSGGHGGPGHGGPNPHHGGPTTPHHGGPGHHHTGSAAHGVTHGSPGVGTGNDAQTPVDVPVNACGNTIDVIGLLNPVFGNGCAQHNGPKGHGHDDPRGHDDDGPKGYGDDEETPPPGPPATPPGHPPTATPPPPPDATPPHTPSRGGGHRPELADTGSDGMLGASAAGMGLLLGGAILYRRNRAASRQW